MSTGLPIEASIAAIDAALGSGGVGVVVASPGAGKTTVVPLRLLDSPWLGAGRILVLEPRRVATRAAARRMAHLLGEPVGATVGYTTRDDRKTSAATRIEVITDGILTRRLQSDPELGGVAAVVFDEFHERRLQSDLGLALTLDVRRSLRPDLRVLVMSATIDAARVAGLIGDDHPAPVIESQGRLHDVEIRWRASDLPVGRRRGRDLAPSTVVGVQEALAVTDGDVLAFLPGMSEITSVAGALDSAVEAAVDVRILHGSLAAKDQDAAIAPSGTGRRKVVLSTDVAETSLTVEGVTAIVDAGMQRRPALDRRTGLTRLVTVAASKASSVQRAGRAGRLGPGLAIRLWSEAEHASRAAHDAPEIDLVDLAALVLEVRLWGANVDELAFVDHPSPVAVRDALAVLERLGALDTDGRLTAAGRAMAALPLHPRAAAVVVAAAPGMRRRAAQLVALIEEGDVLRGRPGRIEADVDLRLALIADRSRRHPDASTAQLHRVRERARDLERRAASIGSSGTATSVASLLAAGYPDRIAQRRPGQRGRFLLRNGAGGRLDDHDPLAGADYCVVADLDGAGADARIALAAGMTEGEVVEIGGADVTTTDTLEWNSERNDLFVRSERRLGAITLSSTDRRPDAGPATLDALSDAIARQGLDLLRPSLKARRLQQRLAFLHRRLGDRWPDVSDQRLVADRANWLTLFAPGARQRRDLERIDVASVLRSRLDSEHHRRLDALAPEAIELPSGRRAPVLYEAEHDPTVRAKVQEVFGLHQTPTVADGVPLLFDLRSPADRTVQVTADLAGFWAGTWHDVRKEMAGRYPRHAWPEIPTRSGGRTRQTGT